MIGAIAAMATHSSKYQRCYTLCVFVSLASFFLIAFGIDGAPALKPIGVTGITLAIDSSGAQDAFSRTDSETNGAAFVADFMIARSIHDFSRLAERDGYYPGRSISRGTGPMVSIHGAINCFIVGPATLSALGVHSQRVAYVCAP